MPNINVSTEDLKQADALRQAIAAPHVARLDICATWTIVKPYWPWIIRAVKLIPTIGDAIAKALELIGAALDAHCAAK